MVGISCAIYDIYQLRYIHSGVMVSVLPLGVVDRSLKLAVVASPLNMQY